MVSGRGVSVGVKVCNTLLLSPSGSGSSVDLEDSFAVL